MKIKPFACLLAGSLFMMPIPQVGAINSASDGQTTSETSPPLQSPTPIPQPTLTPIPETKSPFGKPVKNLSPTKALVIHKPKPSPEWGKVIQYHRDQIFALTDKNREILHEFLFQDEEGVIRTATFHENAEDGGYWEVWVWDQQ